MPKEKISYFISILNSNIFTVKNKSKIDNRTSLLKANLSKLSLISKNIYDKELKFISLSLDFLAFPDYLSVLLVNKKNRKDLRIE